MTATEQQILITRIFDAPRDRVFAAWTDPEQVAAWYGPEQFDCPRDRVAIDLRVGGAYHVTMVQRGSGQEFPVRYEIVELRPPELIVLRHPAMPEIGLPAETFTRVEFHDHGDRTRMTMTDGPYDEMRGNAEAGWGQAFDKLAALVSV